MSVEKTQQKVEGQEKALSEARRVVQILNKLEDTLYRLDLDSLELYTDVTNLRELDALLEDVDMDLVEEIDWNQIYDLATPEKLWEIEVESHSEGGKYYKVRYDIPDDKETPSYTCTCPAFTFGNHSGRYCKHIEEVLKKHGLDMDNPEVPHNASVIGEFTPDT